MKLHELLSQERVAFESGKLAGKQDALHVLSDLLASADKGSDHGAILAALVARENVQSTGMGGGVAVPHAVLDSGREPVAAMLLLRQPIEFDAVDNTPVNILFGLIGPPTASVQHLRALARVSKVLRDTSFRCRLLEAKTAAAAYRLLHERDEVLR